MDDMVPDSALITRLELIEQALHNIGEVMLPRRHLSELGYDGILQAGSGVSSALEVLRERAEPDDPINSKYRSRIRHEYVYTSTDIRFYPYDARPDEVFLEDIAQGLAREDRYARMLPRFLSVAEHSIKVGVICEHLAQQAVAASELDAKWVPIAALLGLLHDAHEAYLGDKPTPLARRIMDVYGTPWDLLKQNLQDVIIEALAVPIPPPEVDSIVSLADSYAHYEEVVALRPNRVSDYKGAKVTPPDVSAIARVSTTPQDMNQMESIWLAETKRLLRVIGGRIPKPVLDEDVVVEPLREAQVAPPQPETVASPLKIISNTSSWRDEVRSGDIYIPPELRDEPEFRQDADE